MLNCLPMRSRLKALANNGFGRIVFLEKTVCMAAQVAVYLALKIPLG